MIRFKLMQQIIGLVILAAVFVYICYPSFFNTLISILAVGFIPFLICRWLFINQMYKYSINTVPKHFVLNKNTLHNEHVTVIYTPDEKIVVLDNFSDRKHAKRTFTLKKGQLNINKAWNRVCRVFDSFVTLDSLVSFYSYDTHVEVITLDSKSPEQVKRVKIDNSNVGPKFVDMNTVETDKFATGGDKVNNRGAQFVDMGNIQEQKQYIPKKNFNQESFANLSELKEQKQYVQKQYVEQGFTNLSDIKEQEQYVEKEAVPQEVNDLGDILTSRLQKIDVNFATASEIAILPGINIVGAKKIVEYRDLNGLYKTEEDFFKVADVKDHFVAKIRAMIVLGEPKEENDEDEFDQGRIIDF